MLLTLWAGALSAGAAELVVLSSGDLASIEVTAWVGDHPSPLLNPQTRAPKWFIGTRTTSLGHTGISFGESREAGARYLRVTFGRRVAVGSLLVLGGGRVSVLKPDAAYPGDVHDDSQWLPAQRKIGAELSTGEVGGDSFGLWTLPTVTETRAVRFSHVALPTDSNYVGWLGGFYLLGETFFNLAPDAMPFASANQTEAARLNNESKDNTWNVWENASIRGEVRPRSVAESPEWVTLIWPSRVALRGLAFLDAGFGAADVYVYVGPMDRGPREAKEEDWRLIARTGDLKSHYPSTLGFDWVDFGGPVTTNAVRIRIREVTNEGHPQIKGHTRGGRRVWLGELMALSSAEDTFRGVASEPRQVQERAVPVEFTLPEAGFVTLVVEDVSGSRIRNLMAETFFPAGKNTVQWDGTNDLGRNSDAANHGVYSIPARLVDPGEYRVRGLWRKAVDLRYEFAVNSPGDPPWSTADGRGGWMADHSPPCSALFVPADKSPSGAPVIYLGSYVGEGGAGLTWVDLEGAKLGGRRWVGGIWTGAQFLARDSGERADADTIAYVGAVWETADRKDRVECRITALTRRGDVAVLRDTFDYPDRPDRSPIAETMGGLAAYNGLIVYSQPALDRIVMVRASKRVGEASLPGPQGVAFDRQGRLLVLSAGTVKRYRAGDAGAMGEAETVVADLDHPVGITLDAEGDIYVAERGEHHQVKRFSDQGRLRMSYGVAGPPKSGRYDPNHMNNPRGLAVDARGRLWVAEEDFTPKRVSVWDVDGQLWRAFYGPPTYGGGGSIDRRDATRFDYAGMEFRLDWTKGESRLERVLYRTGEHGPALAFRSGAPETAVYIQNERFLTNAFNQNPTNGHNTAFIFSDRNDLATPIAGIGRADEWDRLKQPQFVSRWPAEKATPKGRWFVWSDLNRDGDVQPNEVVIQAGEVSGVSVQMDGAFVVARATGPEYAIGRAERFAPEMRGGVPCYNPSAPERLVEGAQPAIAGGGGQVLVGSAGWTILTTAPRPFSAAGVGGAWNGEPRWSYPSLWPGLPASHSAPPPEFPGELIGTTRLLGDFVTPKNSDAGPLFFLNGNLGNIYVFTQDGLMVATLFRDKRNGQAWTAPAAVRGGLLNHITPDDEHFFPTVTQVPDGNIYLVAGKIFSAIVRVDGLESIRRIPPVSLRVTNEQLHTAFENARRLETARLAAWGHAVWHVPLAPKAGLQDADWSNLAWADIDRRGAAAYFASQTAPYAVAAAMAVTPENLIVRWRTGNPHLLTNSGAMDVALFKTGGALDLMLGTDPDADPQRTKPVAGDLRLLIVRVNGKPRALLYRPVVSGTPPERRTIFQSPVRTVAFDRVEDVSGKIELTDDGKGNFQVSVPLEVLDWTPRPGTAVRGDIGILRGNGTDTLERVYWSNKAVALLSDVPSEAELRPDLWGVLRIEAGTAKGDDL